MARTSFHFITTVILVTLLLSGFKNSDAFEPEFIHPEFLTGNAIQYLEGQGVGEDYFSLYSEEIKQGSTDEDSCEQAFTLDCNPFYHAYNPITGNGWDGFVFRLIFDDAITWGEDQYLSDLEDLEQNANSLGRLLHLLEDMGVPAHVHGDVHIDPNPDDFEVWCRDNYYANALDTYIQQGTTPVKIENGSWSDYMAAHAMRTYNVSSFQVELEESVSSQPDSEFVMMFPRLRYREDINFENGNLPTRNYYIPGLGFYFPDGDFHSDWWPSTEDPDGRIYIENIGGHDGKGIVPLMIRTDLTTPYSENQSMLLNSTRQNMYVIYANSLLQANISHVAGFLSSIVSSNEDFFESAYTLNHPTDDVSASITTPGEEDYYKFVVPEGFPYSLTYIGTSKDIPTHATVYNEDGSVYTGYASYAEESVYIFDHFEAGTYYLKITSDGHSTGDYTLYYEMIAY